MSVDDYSQYDIAKLFLNIMQFVRQNYDLMPINTNEDLALIICTYILSLNALYVYIDIHGKHWCKNDYPTPEEIDATRQGKLAIFRMLPGANLVDFLMGVGDKNLN